MSFRIFCNFCIIKEVVSLLAKNFCFLLFLLDFWFCFFLIFRLTHKLQTFIVKTVIHINLRCWFSGDCFWFCIAEHTPHNRNFGISDFVFFCKHLHSHSVINVYTLEINF